MIKRLPALQSNHHQLKQNILRHHRKDNQLHLRRKLVNYRFDVGYAAMKSSRSLSGSPVSLS